MFEFLYLYLVAALLEPVAGALDRVDFPRNFAFTAIVSMVAVVWAFIPGLRLLAVGAVALLLTSCVAARGEGWTYASLGTDAGKVEVRPDTLSITDLKQADGLKHGTQALKDITRLKAMFGLGETLLNKTPGIINSVQTTP